MSLSLDTKNWLNPILWATGANNALAIKDVVKDDYRYNFYEAPTNIDKAKQVVTEVFHAAPKLYVMSKVLEGVGYEVIPTLGDAFSIPNAVSLVSAMSGLMMAKDIVVRAEKAIEIQNSIRPHTSYNLVSSRQKERNAEWATIVLSTIPVVVGYNQGGMPWLGAATLVHHLIDTNVDKKYQYYARAGIVSAIAAANLSLFPGIAVAAVLFGAKAALT